MVIDTSALLALLFGEPEKDRIFRVIAADPRRLASAFSILETGMVVEARKGEAGGRELDLLLHRIELESVPLTASHVEVAREAWRKFGKGKHRANLDIGDCCAYALARISGEPILFKGENFAHTDVTRVEYRRPAFQAFDGATDRPCDSLPVLLEPGLQQGEPCAGLRVVRVDA